jgi:CHAP domain
VAFAPQRTTPAGRKLARVSEVDPEQAADGVVGDAAVLPPEPGDGAAALRAVAAALHQQGRREVPCGSNRNPYSAYFGYGAQFWCADFVAWCVDTTGDRDRRVAWGAPSAVRTISAWAERSGLVVSSPARGDIFTYRNGAHCGLVTGSDGKRFTTVEGNTTGRDGKTCWVAQHTRRVDETYYFVRW